MLHCSSFLFIVIAHLISQNTVILSRLLQFKGLFGIVRFLSLRVNCEWRWRTPQFGFHHLFPPNVKLKAVSFTVTGRQHGWRDYCPQRPLERLKAHDHSWPPLWEENATRCLLFPQSDKGDSGSLSCISVFSLPEAVGRGVVDHNARRSPWVGWRTTEIWFWQVREWPVWLQLALFLMAPVTRRSQQENEPTARLIHSSRKRLRGGVDLRVICSSL